MSLKGKLLNAISEKDIEDWFYADPDRLKGVSTVDRWLARQFRVPSGVIDLLGLGTLGMGLVVVEIKKGAIDARAITQVKRYSHDIYNILDGYFEGSVMVNVKSVCVGTSIDHKSYLEAEACEVDVNILDLFVHTMGKIHPNTYLAEREKRYREIAEQEIIQSCVDQLKANDAAFKHAFSKRMGTDQGGKDG